MSRRAYSPAVTISRRVLPVIPVLGAVAAGRLTAVAVGRSLPRTRTQALVLALVPVALVYPAARTSARDRSAVVREVAGVVAMAGVAVLALRDGDGRRVTAAGWLAHAAFDLLHEKGADSRLPDWYPGVCAGFDAGVAWELMRHRSAI